MSELGVPEAVAPSIPVHEEELPPPNPPTETAKHPFVVAVGNLLDFLAGEPTSAHLEPLYTTARKEYRELLGIPDLVPVHVQEAERAKEEGVVPRKTAQEEREHATQVPHGTENV